MNSKPDMTKSTLIENSKLIHAAYEILDYASDSDVLSWVEEADDELPKRILTTTKNGGTLFITEEVLRGRIKEVRDILDRLEELLK